ncbi:MAG: multifunctional CCA tRNA nucleotidyl transferase/2'3'-cyclic phosphodiesterase/2'nucleotidase/phosphatase [Gammaproteobacteria bacterium]
MKIYLVGGAVRDALLGRKIKERDWVVVGATPKELLAQGFQQVGKDFPVFIHPETGEEYALARTERKIGKGYTGFECDASPNVTLEEDLLRRDLTINAMAQTNDGDIIDPYHGQRDLKEKYLRHVSPAFVEDPLRVLRLARFAARFPQFSVADETMAMMKTIVAEGEMKALTPERVWVETRKALEESAPQRYFEILFSCHAAKDVFPELSKNMISRVSEIAEKTSDTIARFVAVVFDLEVVTLRQLVQRYKIPNEYNDMAHLVLANFENYRNIPMKEAEAILDFLIRVDAFRRTGRFKLCLEIIALFDSGIENKNRDMLAIVEAINQTKVDSESFKGLSGPEIADKIYQQRVKRICSMLKKI